MLRTMLPYIGWGETRIEGEIWCEVHCCVHAETIDPYGYGYAESGEDPECCPSNWRKLWIGAYVVREPK